MGTCSGALVAASFTLKALGTPAFTLHAVWCLFFVADVEKAHFAALVHDRMTEEVYAGPVKTFKVRVALLLFSSICF